MGWVCISKIKKCVIPAAGLGKRLYPLTRGQPKEMLPILSKPVIHYVVEESVRSGIDEILIIVGAGKESIINYFDRHKMDDELDTNGDYNFPEIYFTRQKEQKGLGDAIKYAKHFTGDEDFIVLLGDTIYKSENSETVTSQMLKTYYRIKKTLIALEKIPDSDIMNYGVVGGETVKSGLVKINKFVEKPNPSEAPSNMGITGIYILQKEIYDFLEITEPGKNGEIQLTDSLNLMLESEEIYGEVIKGKRYDIGSLTMWIKTFMEFARENGYN
ncbi:UTP--glucose-1-phosphate uridylyltransferase [Cuniculiplasma sp. SKW4]|uniref:UTP--glucose-1-phosphate uridylyltransferase n=1 Tax=Cuniculiplasma sp. SKW4 TaxID=3400171 RepID=UPI003FD4C629